MLLDASTLNGYLFETMSVAVPETEKRRQAWESFQAGYEAQMHGEMERAVALYEESLKIFPSAEAYTFLGWSYTYQRDFNTAITLCEKAIAVDPGFGNPYNDIGAYLIELGRFDEAIPWLEQATTAVRYDSHCFAWMNLGRIWERKGLWPRAIDCYKQALECDPGYALPARALARLRGRLN